MDLDERLKHGPLKVRSLGVTHTSEQLSRHILRRRRLSFARNLAGACAAAGLLAALFVRQEPAPLASNARVAPSRVVAVEPRRTTFADGSFAQLADAQASLVVEEESPQKVVARLRGKARFKPKNKRTFEVLSGEVRVRVLGSAFSMEELPGGKARVQAEDGPVEVAWHGGQQLLRAGESGAFPPERVRELEAPEVAEASAPEPEHHARDTVRSEPARKKSARHARKNAAREEAPAVTTVDDAATLMAEADRERLHGEPERALKPLRAIFERYPGYPRAPVAAFALGRVLLDDLRRPAEAAQAFARVRTLAPEGALAPDALAREANAWEAAGQLSRAQKLAEQYLELHPRGRHAAAMQKTLAR